MPRAPTVECVSARRSPRQSLNPRQRSLGAIETLGRTNFPARAAAIADEIARVQPHAVGLQEVSKIDLSLPGADLHLAYHEAARIQNIQAAPLPGVSLIDFDVLLVRDGIQVGATTAQNFTANLGVVAPGVTLKRGWVTAVVTAVLMGDLNDAPGSLMYQVLVGYGMVDVWRALRPGVVGNTCCYLADLSNQLPNLTQRLDYVFARGLDRPHAGLQGKVELLGEVPAD